MEILVCSLMWFIYGLLVERIMATYPNFHAGFWDGIALGPLWRFIAKIRK